MMDPITRDEIYLNAILGESSAVELPTPITRSEKIKKAIYDRLKNMDFSSSPEAVGQAMETYVASNPEFWDNIPDGTITRAKLAEGVPEQIRDETLREIGAEEVNEIFDSVFHKD